MGYLIAINKPAGITSHDVIDHLRLITGEKRIGHAGTLDPMATGVLVVGIGRTATRRLAHAEASIKEYKAVIRMDGSSDTLDADGRIRQLENLLIPTESRIDETLGIFVGTITQIPPRFSAIKVHGMTAHKRARSQEHFSLAAREVLIYSIRKVHYKWPLVTIKVQTGPGVYIRSLARDVGTGLGVGGYLTQLRRTRVGNFFYSDCFSLDSFQSWWKDLTDVGIKIHEAK
jgi:tRNA pseudouridine55 synthase